MESIQPIVLVGGRSSRFGKDKLREPVHGGVLVDRPIAALREVFGLRVATVGECHPDVAAAADRVIADRYPGIGPMGGILSALEQTGGAVFVLPGDLPGITGATVRAIIDAAGRSPDAACVVAQGQRLEPCIGVYRPQAAATLRDRVTARQYSLHDVFSAADRIVVPVAPGALRNVNRPGDF